MSSARGANHQSRTNPLAQDRLLHDDLRVAAGIGRRGLAEERGESHCQRRACEVLAGQDLKSVRSHTEPFRRDGEIRAEHERGDGVAVRRICEVMV